MHYLPTKRGRPPLLASHLVDSAGCPLKRKGAVAFGTQFVRLAIRGAHEPASGVIQCIDERCQPLRCISPGRRQTRNSIQKDRIERLRHSQEIRRTDGVTTDVFEVDPTDPPDRARNPQIAPEHAEYPLLRGPVPDSQAPGGIHFAIRVRTQRSEISSPFRRAEPVVHRPRDLVQIEPLFDQGDEGKKEIPVQPVPVQVVGRSVGRDHNGHAVAEERLEQLPENHRIGNVLHLEFVETQEANPRRDVRSHRLHGMARPVLPRAPDRRVDFLHEGVEVHPPPFRLGCGFVEEIHQHRLAATHAAVKVDAAIASLGPPLTARKHPGDPAPARHCRQAMLNDLELLDRGALRVVIADRPFAHQTPVAPDDVLSVVQGLPADARSPKSRGRLPPAPAHSKSRRGFGPTCRRYSGTGRRSAWPPLRIRPDTLNPTAIQRSESASISAAVPIIAGSMIVLALSFGFRSSFGVFLQPISEGFGWPRETFSLSLALQNIAWGLGGPVFGALADRFGERRSLMLGAACYTLGLFVAATATSPLGQHFGTGLLVGMGCAGTGFGLVLAIVGRSVPESRRARVLAVTSAAGSIGQFAVVPLARLMEYQFGWEGALFGLALASLVCFACIPFMRAKPIDSEQAGSLSLGRAISTAGSDSSFWLLTLGFFTCGFHVAFIGAHLPAYVTETCGSATLGSWAISIIGLGNVIGVLLAGEMSSRWRKKHVLSGIYGLRALLILAFLAVPPNTATVVAFSVLAGLVWLATVPLTIHLVAHLHGTRFIATLYGFVFLGHQVGGFLGAWFGGWVYDRTGSYDYAWWIAILLGALSALAHLPIRESMPRLRPI